MAEASCHSGKTIETGGGVATAALMAVKVDLALAKMEETGQDRTPDEKGVRYAIGGEDESGVNMDEGVMLPHETKRVGSQGLKRPDETKRQ